MLSSVGVATSISWTSAVHMRAYVFLTVKCLCLDWLAMPRARQIVFDTLDIMHGAFFDLICLVSWRSAVHMHGQHC